VYQVLLQQQELGVDTGTSGTRYSILILMKKFGLQQTRHEREAPLLLDFAAYRGGSADQARWLLLERTRGEGFGKGYEL
jgi:hypothetical protein